MKGRCLIKEIINRCIICCRFEGPPCRNPPPPPLPVFRVTEGPPFSHTGVDFAGSLYVKSREAVESDKVWICLYTCCITQAVHIDLVPNMTAQAFLQF